MAKTTNQPYAFDTTAARESKIDPTLIKSGAAPIVFPIEQIVGKPAAAKLKRVQRVRRELLSGSYQPQDVMDKVVDRLWADIQALDDTPR